MRRSCGSADSTRRCRSVHRSKTRIGRMRRRSTTRRRRSRATKTMTVAETLDLYYWMRLTRTFDERMLVHWKQGRGVGGTFSQRGHEAIAVGAASVLGPDDVMSPMHRDLGAYLVRGLTAREVYSNLLGRDGVPTRGRD